MKKITILQTLSSLILLLFVSVSLVSSARSSALKKRLYKPFYEDAKLHLKAIKEENPSFKMKSCPNGITVPHHMLAANLIAKGFWISSSCSYDKIIILFPDHFKKSKYPAAIPNQGFKTVLGVVDIDQLSINKFQQYKHIFGNSNLHNKEHGLRAILPFISYFFPKTNVVPIGLSVRSTIAQLNQILPAIKEIITEKSLVIQSTDFSHYLPYGIALQRDQETLNVLSSGDPSAILKLNQPEHLDSIAAQYLQLKIQADLFRSNPLIIENKNSYSYIDLSPNNTTSYILQLYFKDNKIPKKISHWVKKNSYYFAGDTLLGRYFTDKLSNEIFADKMAKKILSITQGRPIILNLEGVILDEIYDRMRYSHMVMPVELAIPWLKRINVMAASVANNHTMDLGKVPYQEMLLYLKKAGIKVLEHGVIHNLDAFQIVAYTDLSNTGFIRRNRITSKDLKPLDHIENATKPIIAFVHWGREFFTKSSKREQEIATLLRMKAVSAIIGMHSHKASSKMIALAGGETIMLYSAGNFIFDQTTNKSSGAIVELRLFKQGTFSSRLIPIPNYYKDLQ